MAVVHFTQNLRRHVDAPTVTAPGATVREVLGHVFARHAALEGYVLDDQGGLRYHMTIFVDGAQIEDRVGLSDAVSEGSELYVMQALSGG